MRTDRHAGHCRLIFLTRGRRALRLCTRPRWRRRKPEHHRPHARAKASRPDVARRVSTRGGAHRGWDRRPTSPFASSSPSMQPDARVCSPAARPWGRTLQQKERAPPRPGTCLGARSYRSACFLPSSTRLDALGGRLLGAMRAGLAAGGEEGPVHSSGLLIVRDVSWPVANLRVDWSDADPIADLERLWALYEPQLEAYVTRAIDPSAAASFGVPGDE